MSENNDNTNNQNSSQQAPVFSPAPNAFFLYKKDAAAEFKNTGVQLTKEESTTQAWSERWKNLKENNPDKAKEYQDKAKELKTIRDKEKAEWDAANPAPPEPEEEEDEPESESEQNHKSHNNKKRTIYDVLDELVEFVQDMEKKHKSNY
jgi:hypothetical protein